ncbi:MAG: SDR family oxidoreductase [Paracoccaceae bacterium]|nr:SDR family oxidoreductase [Paracoccaceae bacterium]
MGRVFITGAGKGIGRAIAERFAAEAWAVSGITRGAEDVERLNRLPDARFWRADASDPVEMARVAEAWGEAPLDLLVNNAGAFAYGTFEETDAPTLERLWRANVMSAFTVTRALLPALTAAGSRIGGRIANIVSVAGGKPLPGKAAYSATKAAQAALFQCLRAEIAEQGVTVTNIYPGLTFTSSFDGEAVDPATMMAAEDVADAVFANCGAVRPGGNCAVEELVLQPARGVRL